MNKLGEIAVRACDKTHAMEMQPTLVLYRVHERRFFPFDWFAASKSVMQPFRDMSISGISEICPSSDFAFDYQGGASLANSILPPVAVSDLENHLSAIRAAIPISKLTSNT